MSLPHALFLCGSAAFVGGAWYSHSSVLYALLHWLFSTSHGGSTHRGCARLCSLASSPRCLPFTKHQTMETQAKHPTDSTTRDAITHRHASLLYYFLSPRQRLLIGRVTSGIFMVFIPLANVEFYWRSIELQKKNNIFLPHFIRALIATILHFRELFVLFSTFYFCK